MGCDLIKVLALFPVVVTIHHLHAYILRNTFTTRMLFTVVPSEMYDKGGATLQGLLNALVEDLNQLYEDGVEALVEQNVWIV